MEAHGAARQRLDEHRWRRCGGGAWSSGRTRHRIGQDGLDSSHEGGESSDEVHPVEHDRSRPVIEGVLESIGNLPAVIDPEAFIRDRRSGNIPAQAFEGIPFVGLEPRAGMEGQSPKLSDARSVRQGIGCEGARG